MAALRCPAIVATMLLVTPMLAIAQAGPIDFHGFGGWSAGKTNRNTLLGADRDGQYGKTNFAVKLSTPIASDVLVSAQFLWRTFAGATQANLDYGFVDWQLRPWLRVRAGKAKHPFGLYSELTGLGTVRPFLNLPQSVYGPIGIVSKSYRGLGVRGKLLLGNQWSAEYDLYGGVIDYDQDESGLTLLTFVSDTITGGAALFEADRVLGSRLAIATPIAGLKFGLSAYSGLSAPDAQRFVVGGAQVEYLNDDLWVRDELVRARDKVAPLADRETALYLELGYFVTPRWQIAGGFNRLCTRLTKVTIPVPPDILGHREWAFGLNRWVTPEFAIKTSIHVVAGNLVANLSEAEFFRALGTQRSPSPTTRLLQAGAQFSF